MSIFISVELYLGFDGGGFYKSYIAKTFLGLSQLCKGHSLCPSLKGHSQLVHMRI